MPKKPPLGNTPEQRGYRHLVMAINVLVANRNWLRAMPDNRWVVVQRIAKLNDVLAALRRAEHVLISTPEMQEDLQLEIDWVEENGHSKE